MSEPLRIFHGPANIASIGPTLARWQRAHGMDALSYGTRASPILDPPDVVLEWPSGFARVARAQWQFFREVRDRFDVFVFYAGRTLLPRALDLPMLRSKGKRLVMVYCGSEARIARIELARNPYAGELPGGLLDPRRDGRRIRRMAWHARWCDYGLAPRDLRAFADATWPSAKIVDDMWIHNAVDLGRYDLARTRDPDPPLIFHAPSNPAIKGTRHVEAAIERLQRRGLRFEYHRLENVDHRQAVEMLAQASIVVDQLLIGGFGTLAAEAMAWGKPVCAYLLPEVKSRHFPDCPIVVVDVNTLENRLAGLLTDTDRRRDLGRLGRSYVERHMDLDDVARRFTDLCASA